MQYKVLSATLGRDGKIYEQGKYIEIASKKDAEELSSFGCILIEELEKVENEEEVKHVLGDPNVLVMPVANAVETGSEPKPEKKITVAVKTPDTAAIKNRKGGKRK